MNGPSYLKGHFMAEKIKYMLSDNEKIN